MKPKGPGSAPTPRRPDASDGDNALQRTILHHMARQRVLLLFLAHLALFALTYATAFALRFDFAVPADMRLLCWQTLPWVLGLKLVVFYRFGSFHGWWRYVTFTDLAVLLRAALLSTLVIAAVDYFVVLRSQIPRAVLCLDCGATILLVGGLRSTWRLLREHVRPALRNDARRPALMVGVDRGGEGLARQIHANPRLNYRIVGFLDADPTRLGSRLGGIPFLATPDDVIPVAQRHQVQDILVTSRSLPGGQLRELVGQCRQANLRVKIIPTVDELLGESCRLEVRDVDISDLLQREPVHLDPERIARMLQGCRVMVTGAGGSIGSEICRQILRHNPEQLVLVERAENALFCIERELQRLPGSPSLAPCLADIGDQKRMAAIFQKYRPQLVFHAAAHKHVPLMESNPGEAIKNNVFGTQRLADLAHEHGVERFVMISTDKAVHPASAMGVSKQLAERYVHDLSERSTTKFIVVRFGNVLGSAGSVVPIFQEQVRCGGPITITHPEMRRFFMTIPEASLLVLEAAALGQGGEIFVLEMGEPVRILDLAHDLIRLSGFTVDEIGIRIIGPRPGEKLSEEVYHEDEKTLPTPHPKLRVAQHHNGHVPDIRRLLDELARVVDEPDGELMDRLCHLVPDYVPPTSDHCTEEIA